MQDKKIQNAFFIGLLILVSVAFLGLLSGFFQPIFWAAIVGIVACTVMVLTVILAPFGLIGFALIWVWMLARSIVGLVRLVDGRGHPDPHGMWM